MAELFSPEVQNQSVCSILSDMFSLGMVICAIFNQGRALIQANHSASTYLKQLDVLEEQIRNILPKIPVPLQEAALRLASKDSRQRPTAQLLSLIKYFSDPAVHALQFLDVIKMKDPSQKSHFYRNTLKEMLPYIPKKLSPRERSYMSVAIFNKQTGEYYEQYTEVRVQCTE
ncbi:hypothetical protein RUM43_003075 [Polyplax serrata]|uniref:Protein kinase domain-containing protein n=1 Tax=Polyplax serrata TaxID=468196 RepID=A0AAN8RWP5_POLSC